MISTGNRWMILILVRTAATASVILAAIRGWSTGARLEQKKRHGGCNSNQFRIEFEAINLPPCSGSQSIDRSINQSINQSNKESNRSTVPVPNSMNEALSTAMIYVCVPMHMLCFPFLSIACRWMLLMMAGYSITDLCPLEDDVCLCF